jgi:uncharacterized membrane protein YjdF
MTPDDLCDDIWRQLGPAKFAAGRRNVRSMTLSAIENWEGESLNKCQGNEDNIGVVAESMVRAIGRKHQEYGFFWMFLLQAVAVAIVQELIRWWFKSASNRAFMVAWQSEMHE